MSLIQNHKCDNCDKTAICKNEWGTPENWFSVNVNQEGEKRDEGYSVEACSIECLNNLLDKAKR